MKYLIYTFLLFFFCQNISGQALEKKVMDASVYDLWKTIHNAQISNDGNWVVYEERPGKGDGSLLIYDVRKKVNTSFERGTGAKISGDNKFLVFRQKPFLDTLLDMRRNKIEKDKLPPDTLTIYEFATRKVKQIPRLQSFQLPEKWHGFLAYQLDHATIAETDTVMQSVKDTLKTSEPPKQESEENGNVLIIRNLETEAEDSIRFVKTYLHAEKNPTLLLQTTGIDSVFTKGIYVYNCLSKNLKPICRKKAKFKGLHLSKNGNYAAFLADQDTTEVQLRPWDLWVYKNGSDSARLIANNQNNFLPKDWIISEHGSLHFSENEQRLTFGIAPAPIFQDTSLLPEEIVEVEVWTSEDKKIYTQQNVQLEEEKTRSFPVIYNLQNRTFTNVSSPDFDYMVFDEDKNKDYALGVQQQKYYETLSWEGYPSYKDIYVVNMDSGTKKIIETKVKTSPLLSPGATYAYWYNSIDTNWVTYHIKSGKTNTITHNKQVPFYDELNDRPSRPRPYGIMAWSEEDKNIFIYDRFDIWEIDPKNKKKPKRLTNGRASKNQYRYIRLEEERQTVLPDEEILLYVFNEENMSSGYARLSLKTGKLTSLVSNNFSYQRYPKKAKEANRIIFTRENFETFPNILLDDLNFKNPIRVSDANPQQENYKWGNISLYHWAAPSGEALKGLLVTPEDFSPDKKYPLLVNFYERSSHRLHRHRHPHPHRSTINYTYYTNRGYVIFNPDVPYKIGYPGKSAVQAVVSGVEALLKEGFVDAKKIGVQGHSWGGYQVAHLLTKTDLFACAESGAPVVNMISAYGGIRWRSGLSRMFQYEKTQSRIGATLWEKPELYIENSPIFNMDKVTTPVLILHNDNDGAVPWYQGIEFFVALRRLGKKAWMLNYNNEPHWPVKRQNRLDFNLRMEQFFDYYLKGGTMPKWMDKGVPAVEKGIRQGLK